MKKMLLFWLPMPFLAILNGFIRERTYVNLIGEEDAHQVSAITLMLILLVYAFIIRKRLGISSVPHAVTCGIVWVLLTAAFESVMELAVLHETIEQVMSHYRPGEWWPIVLLVVGLLPLILLGSSKSELTNLQDNTTSAHHH